MIRAPPNTAEPGRRKNLHRWAMVARDMISCLKTIPHCAASTVANSTAIDRVSGLWRWSWSRSVASDLTWTPRRSQKDAEKGQKNSKCSTVSGAQYKDHK